MLYHHKWDNACRQCDMTPTKKRKLEESLSNPIKTSIFAMNHWYYTTNSMRKSVAIYWKFSVGGDRLQNFTIKAGESGPFGVTKNLSISVTIEQYEISSTVSVYPVSLLPTFATIHGELGHAITGNENAFQTDKIGYNIHTSRKRNVVYDISQPLRCRRTYIVPL